MAFRGGCYADFLPAWLDTFGTERLHVIDFEQLVADPADTCGDHRGGPRARSRDASRPMRSSSENRTTGFKSKAFQRVALQATTGSSGCCAAIPTPSASSAPSTTD